MLKKSGLLLLMILMSLFNVAGQISPGDLASPHAHLEGLSNCTQCHTLGSKISDGKCLICHTEIRDRISLQKGYHSSSEIKGKECITCHNDHHGKNFQLIRFDTEKFDHSLTGYTLSLPHSKIDCIECHTTKFITDKKVKIKKLTYLGLGTECLTCHPDYHKETLSSDCLSCHNPDSFKPASRFDHANSRFKLAGKHKEVQCLKCHNIDIIQDGEKFQNFTGIQFNSCTNCHKDPHSNKFGQTCTQCHSEESFQIVKGINNFDHNKTEFKLEGRHLELTCIACHKTRVTDPLKHNHCTDCHSDYHKRQFVKNGISPDCSQCHNVNGFTLFSYTLEQHNKSIFPLLGSHLAVPCFECHKKQKEWNFRGIGLVCKDCHADIHLTFIQEKYYSGSNCKNCHNENSWREVTFDHAKTEFILTGAHIDADCRDCHISNDPDGTFRQKFTGMSANCTTCHKDEHYNQFEKNGMTNCSDCHDTDNWKASKFNHNNTSFRLDGKHTFVPCAKCHKPLNDGSNIYIKYKLNVSTCESCHS